LVNSSSILIQGNRFTHNSNNFDRWSSGIFGLDDSFNITITQNNITRNDQGIILLGYNNTVSLNNIADNWEIGVEVSTDSIVTQNNITGQQGDGVLVGGSGCLVSFNNMMSNLASNIDIVYGSNGTVTSNNIVSNGQPDENIFGASHTGVSIQLSTNFIITLNNFIGCSGSAIFTNRGSNNTIFHNNFLNNAKELGSFDLYGTSTNTWDNGYPSGGNYWSNYNGTDSDGDGIGDTPYALDANNTDNYPLMQPRTENPLPLTCSLRIIGWIGNSTITGFYDTTYPRPGTYIFIANSTIHVDTLCRYNIVIDRWELDDSAFGSGEFVDVLMDANHTLGLFVSTVPSLNVSISPANVTVKSEDSVTFNSSLSGGKPPYDYQWCVNGSIIWGATAPTWTFTPGKLGIYNITLMVSYPFSNGWTSNPTTSNAAWIVVTIPGDINSDFKVSLADLVLLANAYGSTPADTKWNPNADINDDGKVSLSDLVIMANHYGQHYP
jgi:nitrous oxidase accessory protein NosD